MENKTYDLNAMKIDDWKELNDGGSFHHCKFYGLCISGIENSEFNSCNFIGCGFDNMKNSHFNYCTFENCHSRNGVIDDVTFTYCDLTGMMFADIKQGEMDISQCKTNYNPSKFLEDNFEYTSDGLIGYKIFGLHCRTPLSWSISPISEIYENGNTNIYDMCGAGFNLGSWMWVYNNALGNTYWKVLVPNKSLHGIIVPYQSDGKIRVCNASVILLERLTFEEFLGQTPKMFLDV